MVVKIAWRAGMNGLDFVIWAVLAAGGVYGLSRGALRMITSVLSLVAALYLASLYYPQAGAIAQRQLALNPTPSAAIGYAAVFAAVFAAVEMAGALIARILHTVHLGWLDRLGGAALGLAITGALAGVCLMLLAAVLPSDAPLLRQSRIAPQLLVYSESLVAYVPAEVKQAYEEKRAALYRFWLERAAGLGPGPTPSPGAAPGRVSEP